MSDDVREVLEAVKRHPGQRTVVTQTITAASMFGIAAFGLVVLPAISGPFALLGAVFAWSVWDVRRSLRGIVLAGRAHAAVSAGDRELAAKLLDMLDDAHAGAQFRRIAATHRGSLAMSGADPREAIVQSTKALGEPLGLLVRDATKSVAVLAASQRALARAMVHEDEAALVDADATNGERYVTPTARAQAELARALVAANRDHKDEVRAILERSAPYMEDLGGRARELAKRLARFAAPGKRTIYRHAAKSEDDIAALIATPAKPMSELASPSPVSAAPPPVAATRRPNLGRRAIALWVLLILVFLAIWQLLNPADGPPRHHPTEPISMALAFGEMSAIFVVIFCGLIALNLRRAARIRTQRRVAVMKALGGDAAGVATLEHAAKTSPEAALELAQAHERQADFARALQACDSGIAMAMATRISRVTSHDVTLPGLYAERAFCFAALGKIDEAAAVISAMPNAATFTNGPLARFRVGLAQTLARGDRKGALEIARKRGDTLGTPRRDAVLIDLLEATEGAGASDEEWSRLHAELAADPALAKWIDHFMPKGTMQRRVAEAEPLEEEESLERAREEGVDA